MKHGDEYNQALLDYIEKEAKRFGHSDFIHYCKQEFNELWREGKILAGKPLIERRDPRGKGFVKTLRGKAIYSLAWLLHKIGMITKKDLENTKVNIWIREGIERVSK